MLPSGALSTRFVAELCVVICKHSVSGRCANGKMTFNPMVADSVRPVHSEGFGSYLQRTRDDAGTGPVAGEDERSSLEISIS
jgi:hypothetical protein